MLSIALRSSTLVSCLAVSTAFAQPLIPGPQAEACRSIECSGRHISCDSHNPLAKLKCEVRKSRWKAE
jgi:hypothetical protein